MACRLTRKTVLWMVYYKICSCVLVYMYVLIHKVPFHTQAFTHTYMYIYQQDLHVKYLVCSAQCLL